MDSSMETVNAAAIERVAAVRDWMIRRPETEFFGVLATRLVIVPDWNCETAATDGVRLLVNPGYIAGLPDLKLAGLIAHEVLHCSNRHFDRLGDREFDLANMAADYAINPLVLAAGLELPDGLLIDARFYGWAFEEIYSQLLQERDSKPQPQPEQSDGQAGQDQAQPQAGQDGGQDQAQPGNDSAGQDGAPDGQGKPQNSDSGSAGQDMPGKPENAAGGQSGKPITDPGKAGAFFAPDPDATNDNGETIGQQWETAVRQMAKITERDGRTAGAAKSIIDELAQARIDWRAALRDFITDRAAMDYSWNRPNRRHIAAGLYLPSLQPDGIDSLVFFVDTSGSMNKPAFMVARAELQEMLDSGWIGRIHVIQGDTRLQHAATYESGDIIPADIYGNGGTDFRDCMAYIAENHADSAALLAFTDLEIQPEKIGDDPGIPTLWLVWGNARTFPARAAVPQFGESIPIRAD
jgi:predicted metal-dependent peptidase